MSYLDSPRLAFAGDFQADVSTVNNDVRHYDNATFEERFQRYSEGPTENGWWNPVGGAAFRLLNCRVRSATTVEGAPVEQDEVVGAVIGGSSDRVSAKMVDLDPQWQLSSQLWGLRIEVVLRDEVLLGGHLRPEGFRDIWFPGRTGVRHQLTAKYISVLEDVEWAPSGRSSFVDALRRATAGDSLSVRLVTFAYDTNHRSPRFTIGTVIGTIGPYRSGEPHRFVRGRRFAPKQPTPSAPLVNYLDAQVTPEGDAVNVDLGNALPVADGVGAMVDIGDLRLALLTDDGVDEGDRVAAGQDYVALDDRIDYRARGWLLDTAGVIRADVPPGVRPRLTRSPLAIVRLEPGGADERVLIRETPGGWHVRADEVLHRVDAGRSTTTAIYACRFGVPVAGARVDVILQPPQEGLGGGSSTAPDQPPAPIPITGTPPAAVHLDAIPLTDSDGRTTCSIRTSDPGNPRGYVDGQLYQFRVDLPVAVDLRSHPFDTISVVVFDAFEVPEHPTWVDHVQPIFTQYGNLYPVMSQWLVDLGDYPAVVEHRELLRFTFALDVSDPNYMPVTRDLSGPKRKAILRWLESSELEDGPAPPSARGGRVEGDRRRRHAALRAATPTPPPPDAKPDSVEPKLEFVRSYLRP